MPERPTDPTTRRDFLKDALVAAAALGGAAYKTSRRESSKSKTNPNEKLHKIIQAIAQEKNLDPKVLAEKLPNIRIGEKIIVQNPDTQEEFLIVRLKPDIGKDFKFQVSKRITSSKPIA